MSAHTFAAAQLGGGSPRAPLRGAGALAAALALSSLVPAPYLPVWTFGSFLALLVLPLSAHLAAQTYSGARPALLLVVPAALGTGGMFLLGGVPLSEHFQRYLYFIPWAVVTLVGLLWCVTVVGPRVTVGLACLGGAVAGYLAPLGTGNVWKYGVGWFVIVVVLVIFAKSRRGFASAAVGLIACSLLFSTRSLALFVAVAALASLYSRRSRLSRRQVLGTTLLGVLASEGFLRLALLGAFGHTVQQTTLGQAGTKASLTSLLFGARPELRGNIESLSTDLLSFEFGRPPSFDLYNRYYESAVGTGGTVNSPQLEGYTLSSHGVELHSIVADLWYHWSVFGVVVGVILLLLFVRGLGRNETHLGDATVRNFVLLSAIFYLLFGVMSDFRIMPIALLVSTMTFTGHASLTSQGRGNGLS